MQDISERKKFNNMTSLTKKFDKFDTYLDEIGVSKLPVKGKRELSRFIARGKICIVSFNKKEKFVFSNDLTKDIHKAFKENRIINIQEEKRRNLKDKFKVKLWRRDKRCFYSFKKLPIEELTIEHLVPLSKGGKNNMDNLVLCSKEENDLMGNKPLLEKLKYREEKFLKNIAKINYKKKKTKKIGIIRKIINFLRKK